MALTGLVLCGFILGHMIGNLQAFLPAHAGEPHALDTYGRFLREMVHGAGLWVVRAGLLLAAGLHVWAYFSLLGTNAAARPEGYRVAAYKESTWASRTMKVTGPVLLAFIVFHLLHLTVGWKVVHPRFEEGQVFRNLITGLGNPLVAGFYVLAMGALAFHVWHGFWSMFQTLGANHPKYNPLRKKAAVAFAILVAGGFALVPIAVVAGMIR